MYSTVLFFGSHKHFTLPDIIMPITRSQTNLSNTKRIINVDRTPRQAFPGPVIEWLDLDFSETSPVKQVNWKDSLNEMIQGVEGCSHITFACPLEMPHRLWIIIGKDQDSNEDKKRRD
jgi:hypothetical protein